MNPKISVIIPSHNSENTIEKCIRSIEASTYDNLELIVIDTSDKIDTGYVVYKLRDEYDNIVMFEEQNLGVSHARNTGLVKATGEYFTFVDADDVISPEMISTLYESIVKTNADVCGCSFAKWTDKTVPSFGSSSSKCNISTFSPEDYLMKQILQGNSRCWSKLYRRSSVGLHRFPEGLSIGEDALFLVTLLDNVSTIAEIDYKGYGYYINQSGAMLKPFTPSYMDQISCWEKIREVAAQIVPESYDITTKLVLQGIILTVSKIAVMSKPERNKNKAYVSVCHDKICEELEHKEGYALLSAGYKLKSKLFCSNPALYIKLYSLLK